jgi:hypothetical protein
VNGTPESVDRHVAAVIEQSAIVAALQRFARKMHAIAMASRARSYAAAVAAAVAARRGTVLMAAVVTHVALVAVLGRPRGGYWLILPALFAVTALILQSAEKRPSNSGD